MAVNGLCQCDQILNFLLSVFAQGRVKVRGEQSLHFLRDLEFVLQLKVPSIESDALKCACDKRSKLVVQLLNCQYCTEAVFEIRLFVSQIFDSFEGLVGIVQPKEYS